MQRRTGASLLKLQMLRLPAKSGFFSKLPLPRRPLHYLRLRRLLPKLRLMPRSLRCLLSIRTRSVVNWQLVPLESRWILTIVLHRGMLQWIRLLLRRRKILYKVDS